MTPLVIGLAAVIVVILVAVAVGLRFVRHDERADLAERPADRGGARGRKDADWRSPGQRALPERVPARQEGSARQRRSGRGHEERAGGWEVRGRAAAGRRQDDRRHAGAAQAAPGGSDRRDEPARARPHQDDLSQLRARQVRGRRDDAADWPSTEWDKLSDADYWKEVASDRPLITTARTAQPQRDQGQRDQPQRDQPQRDQGHRDQAASAGPAGYARDLLAAPTAGLAAPAAGLAAGPGRPESARPERGRLERGRLEPARPAHPGSEANPGHPGMPRRLRPVVQVPDDDDPLTSPSFPKAVSSDSRSYRNGRSAGPNGYHAVEPDIGQAATAAYSYRPVPQPAPGNYAAASYQPSGHVPANGSGIPAAAYQPERSAAGRAAPAASPPSGNPYGSYVSSDLPGYLENPAPSYHRARSESGYASYPAGAENGRSAAPYPYSSPAIDSAPPGDNWKSSWYPDAPAASAPAAPPARPIPLPQADLYAVPGTPDHLNGNGHYSSPGYAPGSYPDGRFDAPGYPPAGYRGQPDVSRHPPVPGDSGAQRDLAGYLPGEFYGRDDYGRQQRR